MKKSNNVEMYKVTVKVIHFSLSSASSLCVHTYTRRLLFNASGNCFCYKDCFSVPLLFVVEWVQSSIDCCMFPRQSEPHLMNCPVSTGSHSSDHHHWVPPRQLGDLAFGYLSPSVDSRITLYIKHSRRVWNTVCAQYVAFHLWWTGLIFGDEV